MPRGEVYAPCVLIWRPGVNDVRTPTMRSAGFRVVRGGSEVNRTAIRFTRRWIGEGFAAVVPPAVSFWTAAGLATVPPPAHGAR